MRPPVSAAFAEIQEHFEGRMPCMYLDTHNPGLVTCGVGNLIDPLPAALPLPWSTETGFPASKPQITAEWQMVKSLQSMRYQGNEFWIKRARLTLSENAIDTLMMAKAISNDTEMAKGFPRLADWSADAQMAVHLMAWAMGPGFYINFPRFRVAANNGDWLTAAIQSHIQDSHVNTSGQTVIDNAGLVPRNAAIVHLLESAATTANPAILHWPPPVSLT